MSVVISDCGTYRYMLTRRLHDISAIHRSTLFIMLNPSTADARLDDPTIRRCMGFAKTWGCRGIVVANLYALRSTDQSVLWQHPDPIGPENDAYLAQLAGEHETVVCAWGGSARSDRVDAVKRIFDDRSCRLMCLGVTKSGSPRHPLFVRADTQRIPWPVV